MILFGKTDFIKEKRTTCAREHSLCLCGTDSGFGLQIFAYNRHVFCIEPVSKHIQLHIYTHIYIFEVYEYINEYRCTFSKKKKVCMPRVVWFVEVVNIGCTVSVWFIVGTFKALWFLKKKRVGGVREQF